MYENPYIGDILNFRSYPGAVSRHYWKKPMLDMKPYKLLLEIGGIRSRLLGETEILAQFKEIMRNEALPKHSLGDYLKNSVTKIIEDSRKSEGHLRFLGDQSYGGLANRYLKSTKEVVLFGTGNLAVKVLPWLLEKKQKSNSCWKKFRKA